MARGKKGQGWKKDRRTNNFESKIAFYVFSEGTKTEPNYIKGFKNYIEKNPIYKDMILIETVPCQSETLRVVQAAEKYVKEKHLKKGNVWCLYDKDSFPEKDFNEAEQKINALDKSNIQLNYYAGWSNQCIEYWFLLHFSNYTSDNNRKYYFSKLDEEFKKYELGSYEKNKEDIFEILLQYGNPKNAIKFAKRRFNDTEGMTPSQIAPATKVYELVEQLAKYLPEDIAGRFIY